MVAFGGCDQSVGLSSVEVVVLDYNVALCRVALSNEVLDDFVDLLIDREQIVNLTLEAVAEHSEEWEEEEDDHHDGEVEAAVPERFRSCPHHVNLQELHRFLDALVSAEKGV